jgi:hypothetical protein
MKPKIKLALVLIILFLGLVPSQFSALGQVSNWSDPILLSDEGTGWFPDIVADIQGNVHVAWSSGIETDVINTNGYKIAYDLVLYRTSPDGINWGQIYDIKALIENTGLREVTRPSLLTDNNGTLHLTFRDIIIRYSNALIDLAPSAYGWSPDRMINSGYFSRMAKDSTGTLHILFTDNAPSEDCQECYHTFYLNSQDDGRNFSSIRDISGGPLGSAKPQLIIDNNDYIHIVWEEGIGGGLGQLSGDERTDVIYTNSTDSGNRWKTPIKLNTTEMNAKNIAIGVTEGGTLLAVWWDVVDDSIYYRTSLDHGETWSIAKLIPGISGIWAVHQARLDGYSMDTDSAGNIHLVMVGQIQSSNFNETVTPSDEPSTPSQKQLHVIHLMWNGSSWSQPDILATYEGDVPEWPRIAVGLGNKLHVSWFVRNEEDVWAGGGDYSVWYSQGESTAPEIKPESLPSPNLDLIHQNTTDVTYPTPYLNPDKSTITTENPLEPIDNVNSLLNTAVYEESDYLFVLTISLIPALIFIALLIFGLRRLKRH